MSFYSDIPPQAVVDALAQGDYDTAAMLMGDSQSGLEDFLATQTFVTLTGTTDGSGNATIAHNVDLTGASVIMASGFWNNSGTSVPLTITGVDATNVTVTGGGATKALRITLIVAVGLMTF